MPPEIEAIKQQLLSAPRRWLVTGVAGFIGSNIAEALLNLGQQVRGLDNFSTGTEENLEDIERSVGEKKWQNFSFIEGDIRDFHACSAACRDIDFVLHQAALGSVPRSIEDPCTTDQVNVGGFVNMAVAAKENGIRRFVYASSSSVYGDSEASPKKEGQEGQVLSPYAASKLVNEIYSSVFCQLYDLEIVGLRYFNVFGPRQSPVGAYAAVIPKWIDQMLSGEPCVIYGTGETTRDFCFIDNAVQANLLAAVTANSAALNRAYNISYGDKISLNDLYRLIRSGLVEKLSIEIPEKPEYQDFRPGDVLHSLADIGDAERLLGFKPVHSLQGGMDLLLNWYAARFSG